MQRKNFLNSKGSILLTGFILISSLLIPIGTCDMAFENTIDNQLMVLNQNPKNQENFASHHKVLIEFATATDCPFCPYQETALPQISGDYQVITMPCSHYTPGDGYTPSISSRLIELGQSGIGYPTSWFDGGYTRVTGGSPSILTQLQDAYDASQSRQVADVDLTIFPVWKNDNTLDVTFFVDNTDSSSYQGHLHIYVLEKTSRWFNYNNQPFKDAFLSYAFNADITVGAGETWISSSEGWSYPDTSMDNLLVVGSVFTRTTMLTDDTDVAEPVTGGDDDDDPILMPKIKINEPGTGDVINDTVTILGTSHYPSGDEKLKWTMVKIDDGSWEITDEVIYWQYEWDTTTVEDGEHIISAICSDGVLQSAIYQVTVTVRNDEEDPDPEPDLISDLDGQGVLSWSDIEPTIVVSGEITIQNIGDDESSLNWEIDTTPSWGDWTFTPNEGYNLAPKDGIHTIDVLLVVPDEESEDFTGEIKIINKDNVSDSITVPVSLTTTKTKGFDISMILIRFLERYPWFEFFIHHIIHRFP